MNEDKWPLHLEWELLARELALMELENSLLVPSDARSVRIRRDASSAIILEYESSRAAPQTAVQAGTKLKGEVLKGLDLQGREVTIDHAYLLGSNTTYDEGSRKTTGRIGAFGVRVRALQSTPAFITE